MIDQIRQVFEAIDDKPDFIMSLCALVVAVCALFATGYQAYLSRRHNRLSVEPYLGFAIHDSMSGTEYICSLVNHGIGPARITQFIYTVDGVDYNYRTKDLLNNALERIGFTSYAWTIVDVGEILPAGYAKELLVVDYTSDWDASLMAKVGWKIEYESMYGVRYSATKNADG